LGGIAHGFATLGTIGFERRFDYAAIGTVSNVASRLCDEAKPGQILISPRVLTKVEKAVTVEPIGEFELKGIRRPLAAYNVVAGPTSASGRGTAKILRRGTAHSRRVMRWILMTALANRCKRDARTVSAMQRWVKEGHSIAAGPQRRLSRIKDALRCRLRSRLNATANVT
jgi:Adenylate and Guanylate cyclase catalytic domain